MQTIAQAICVRWTKASRGGAAATRRNRAPEWFEVHDAQLGEVHGISSQCITLEEHQDFVPSTKASIGWSKLPLGELRFQCCEISSTENGLLVRYDGSRGGAPIREPYGTNAFVLADGTWGRLTFNGRHTDWHGWRYEKTVINIARAPTAKRDMFAGAPDFEASYMADLW